jgi:hypothetical protein
MPISSRSLKMARVAAILSLGTGLLLVAGCGPPELGSVKVPAELRRGARLRYGPGASRPGTVSPSPGQFPPAPKAKPGRRGR